jgi:hypothetical protein
VRNPRLLFVVLGLVALPLIALAAANTRNTATPSLSEQLAAWQRSHPDYSCSVTSQTDQTITADCEKGVGGATSETMTAVSLRISNGSLHGAGFHFSSPSG